MSKADRAKLWAAPAFVLVLLASTFSTSHADSVPRQAGRAAGEFGAGVGEAVVEPLTSLRPEWVTIAPRSKEECMAESGGVVNTTFMRCRSGWQEYVQYDRHGRKRVISERPIPAR